jgi:hypothetical protein
MIINDENGYIFVHIPRTSGTHLYQCLSGEKHDNLEYGHIFARKVKNIFPDQWDKYYTFSIVRNDFDRLHSWWYNRRHLRGTIDCTFEEWLLRDPIPVIDIHANWDNYDMWSNGAQRTSQLEWIYDNQRNLLVDHIVRYEDLKEGLDVVGKAIGVDFSKMPRHGPNNSVNRDYKKAYTPTMIKFVETYHWESLNQFGYHEL